MKFIQIFFFAAALCLGVSAHAQPIAITPVTTADYGTVAVGQSKTLSFNITSTSFPPETLRHVIQTSDIADGWGATPSPHFSLAMGTCNAQWDGTGSALSAPGCRIDVTFAPTAAVGALNAYVIASNQNAGAWANLTLVAAAAAAPVSPASIPTLSQWGMILMSAMLGLFAAWRMRGRA